MKTIISGIQQMGIGVANLHEAFAWYRKAFGVDIPILDDEGTAELMLPYTGGKPQKRHAILAVSIKGGGGLEIWNYTQRVPQAPAFTPQLGDLGICITKIKTENAKKSFDEMKSKDLPVLGEISNNPTGAPHFFIKDPYGNIFEIIEEESDWFDSSKRLTGGVYGAMIGVSDMEKSMKFYREILGFDKILFDQTDVFADIAEVSDGKKFRRVLLTHSQARKGPFSELLGQGYIELFQAFDYTPRRIFEGRQWGDLGFIHLCFDVKNMDGLKEISAQKGFPFTVDSGNFGMGAAAGRFTYTEDPDGALIEFVETYKIPIMKKWGVYLNLRKRDAEKPLPRYILKALKFMRVK
ncbi:MAG: VOC family protein [Bacteroidales bacterium]|jgi:catechol 2,3-dioxygenase-like lactoylglutathione lyase family enzyme|nr:VOC family protein [Bacteroidales bacterium]